MMRLYSRVWAVGAMTQGAIGCCLLEPYQDLGLTKESQGRCYELPDMMTREGAMEFVRHRNVKEGMDSAASE
jgi:hypothetical protein